MGSTARRLAAATALAALLVTALGLSGCSNSGCTCPDEVEVTYKLRTSPEDVLYNLKTAYVYMNLDEYLDCLAEEFVFHLNPNDYDESEMPESWGKQDEEDIHENMFASDSDVERIALILTDGQKDYDTGPNPVDPMDDRWHYWEGVDLRVAVAGDLTFCATAEQEFTFRIDPLEVGPEGETLYEIIDWWDLEDLNRPGGSRSWGSIKALFR